MVGGGIDLLQYFGILINRLQLLYSVHSLKDWIFSRLFFCLAKLQHFIRWQRCDVLGVKHVNGCRGSPRKAFELYGYRWPRNSK
ncbi:hypothetical protein HHK36_001910 [Tetracentron sinense]|uniref:Uncharacterized protein n=1 Tax=Tetracentron sinense TaxID=13715 RepID=A0A835DV53_TETSI|nr:hypothetical protein HHK36_001910 [Tetracentron sinense]